MTTARFRRICQRREHADQQHQAPEESKSCGESQSKVPPNSSRQARDQYTCMHHSRPAPTGPRLTCSQSHPPRRMLVALFAGCDMRSSRGSVGSLRPMSACPLGTRRNGGDLFKSSPNPLYLGACRLATYKWSPIGDRRFTRAVRLHRDRPPTASSADAAFSAERADFA